MAKKPKKEDALAALLTVASSNVLTDLILQLAADRPDVRRECFDFLKMHASLSKTLEKRSEGEIVLALWSELAPDLSELDDYGGGDYATEDHVAEEGLRNGQGRMDELRRFVAARAEASGDREKYLAIQFDQATDGLTLQKYKIFKKLCKKAEWAQFESKVLVCMKNAWRVEQLKIRMHRKEFDEAVAILTMGRYPTTVWEMAMKSGPPRSLKNATPKKFSNTIFPGSAI